MIIVVEPYNAKDYRHHLDQMFRQRALVFYDRLRWDVKVHGGLERDRYDDMSPTYVLDVNGDVVNGSLRLLPTTWPTFSEELFPGEVMSHPSIWECSRLCVVDSSQQREVATKLLLAVAELSIQRGIETIIANVQKNVMYLVIRIGFDVELLDYTDRFSERVYLCSARMNRETIEKIKPSVE